MRTIQGNMVQSLRAVQAFLDDNATELSDAATSGARKKLDEVMDQLHERVIVQTGSEYCARGAITKRVALRRVLVMKHMAPIARIARAALPVSPELESFRFSRGKPTAERLAQAAAGMATTAGPHVATFVRYGMPADFIDRLEAAAQAMLDAVDDGKQRRGFRAGATKSIAATLTAARKPVHVLDAFVTPAVDHDPALLAWNTNKEAHARGEGDAGNTELSMSDGAPIE
jgi:hypothetical protein